MRVNKYGTLKPEKPKFKPKNPIPSSVKFPTTTHVHCWECGRQIKVVYEAIRVHITEYVDVGMTESNYQWVTSERWYCKEHKFDIMKERSRWYKGEH